MFVERFVLTEIKIIISIIIIINTTHWWTGSHCSCRNTGAMWSQWWAPVTRQAAAFCTNWRWQSSHRWCCAAV